MIIKEHVPLKPYTVFKIGGPARFFAEVESSLDLKEALGFAVRQRLPFFILGAGSNILVSDRGFNGVAIRMIGDKVKIDGEKITADAGVMMPRLAAASVKSGFVGLEWGVGIPGTLGGSVRGNSGCFGGEIKDFVSSVNVFDAEKLKNFNLSPKECEFSYRHSIFKKRPEWVILSSNFKLRKENLVNAEVLLKQMREQSKRRIKEQPIGENTAGSTFKSVSFDEGLLEELSKENAFWKKENPYSSWVFQNRSGLLGAGFLIELAGLKGYKIGGAEISTKHTNFLINRENARAEEIVMLIGLIKERVHRKFGIFLEEEIQYVGF
jgi:UDP-N-acetylmuramate dehydrogenase